MKLRVTSRKKNEVVGDKLEGMERKGSGGDDKNKKDAQEGNILGLS